MALGATADAVRTLPAVTRVTRVTAFGNSLGVEVEELEAVQAVQDRVRPDRPLRTALSLWTEVDDDSPSVRPAWSGRAAQASTPNYLHAYPRRCVPNP